MKRFRHKDTSVFQSAWRVLCSELLLFKFFSFFLSSRLVSVFLSVLLMAKPCCRHHLGFVLCFRKYLLSLSFVQGGVLASVHSLGTLHELSIASDLQLVAYTELSFSVSWWGGWSLTPNSCCASTHDCALVSREMRLDKM